VAEAYPLCWPAGWPRSVAKSSRFKATLGAAVKNLVDEIRRLGGTYIVISTNMETKGDGTPYANRRMPSDTGVAVYFSRDGQEQCFPCDRWDRIEDNIHAICLTIQAIRGIERWGSGKMMQAAFNGFKALPAPPPEDPWWVVLNCEKDWKEHDVEAMFKKLAFQYHPDRGGSVEAMTRINNAYSQFKQERNR